MDQEQNQKLKIPPYLKMDMPDRLIEISANTATIQTLPSQQTNPLPIFADDLYTELKSTKTINELASVFEEVLKVHEQSGADRDSLNNAKIKVKDFFTPYKSSMDQMLAPSEDLPKLTFQHPEWTFQTYINYLRTEKIEKAETLMPIANGLAYLDARPNRPVDLDPDTGTIATLPTQIHAPAVEAVNYVAPQAADGAAGQAAIAEVLYAPPRPEQPELPERPGYPKIVTGSPLEYAGAPQHDKENACIVYIGSKEEPNNIDIPQTLQGFQEYANAIGYGPIHCQHFLERLAKIKWGLSGFDPYKHLSTPTEITNNMLQVTWKPKLMDEIEKVTKFERMVGENIHTTYNRLKQSLAQCLSFMPNQTERDDQIKRKADKGILNLIHPWVQARIKVNRTLSNYHHQKHDIRWDLHYIEISESHAANLKPVVPLKLKADIEGINVNFHALYHAQLPTAFPSLYAGVKRPRQEESPPKLAPLDKKYRPNETNIKPNRPTTPQQQSSQPPGYKQPSPQPPPMSPTAVTPPPIRIPTPDRKPTMASPTTRRRLSFSPGTRRFTSSSPGGSTRVAYDRTNKKFVRVPKQPTSQPNSSYYTSNQQPPQQQQQSNNIKPIQSQSQVPPYNPNQQQSQPNMQQPPPNQGQQQPQFPQQPTYGQPNPGFSSRFSPQAHAQPPPQYQYPTNRTGFSPNRQRTGFTPPNFSPTYSSNRASTGYSPNRQQTRFSPNRPQSGYSPFNRYQNTNQSTRPTGYSPYRRPMGYSPYGRPTGYSPYRRQTGFSPNRQPAEYNPQWQRQQSRSPSPGPGRPRYTSTDRPGRTPSIQPLVAQRNRSITPNTAFRQTERNMTAILDKDNVAFWKEKTCRYCQKPGHSAAICAAILCPKCHLTGQHPHDYHCLLARQKHNLLMTAANPYKNKKPNQPTLPPKQAQTLVTSNAATISEEQLLPIINKALEEALPKYAETQQYSSQQLQPEEETMVSKNLL